MVNARKRARNPARSRKPGTTDAIALLKADHRQVKEWFESFQSSRSEDRKQELAQSICQALKVHTEIEHEIFYPAFLEATEEEDIHHEAEVEHGAAKKLIGEIEGTGPSDEYFEAKVKVLSEMIKHHVKEEEQPGGMFAKARDSDMDLQTLGEQLAARKAQLMESASDTGEGNGRSRAKPRHESALQASRQR